MLSAWKVLCSLCMSDFLSFTFQLKCQGGLCQLLYLKRAHNAVSQHLQSIHHSYCLSIYLLNVFLLGEGSKGHVCLISVGAPRPLELSPAHNRIGAWYPGSAELSSCPLPVQVGGAHSPAGRPAACRNKHPRPRFHPVFTACLPHLNLTHFPGGFIWLGSWLMINVNSVIGQQFGGRCFLGSTSHWS